MSAFPTGAPRSNGRADDGTPPEFVRQDAGAGEPQPPTESKAEAAAESKPKPDPAAELTERVAALERELGETRRSESYWQGRALAGNQTGKAEAEPEPGEEIPVGDLIGDPEAGDDEPTPEQFLDALSAKGVRAVDEALRKQGYVRKAEVAELVKKIAGRAIKREREKITADAALLGEFPELRDPNSALTAAMRPYYQELVALDPAVAKSPSAILMAARMAKQKMDMDKAAKSGADSKRDYRDSDSEQLDRLRAQQGDRGRRNAGGGDDEDDALTPNQKRIIAALQYEGLTEDSYIAAARRGVNVSARNRRQ